MLTRTALTITAPIIPGDGRRIVYRDTVRVDEDGNLLGFVSREWVGDAMHPVTTRDVEADLDRYGKLAAWR